MFMKESHSLSLCRDYLSPRMEVLSFSTEGLVCESDTERVDEEDGEW
jgi:hypothetical protein